AWRNADLVELMLPIVRADLTINDTYVHQPEEPLSMPVIAFCGSDDHLAPAGSVQAWQKETTSVFRCHVLPGKHFFLHSSWPLFAETLRTELDLATSTLSQARRGPHIMLLPGDPLDRCRSSLKRSLMPKIGLLFPGQGAQTV